MLDGGEIAQRVDMGDIAATNRGREAIGMMAMAVFRVDRRPVGRGKVGVVPGIGTFPVQIEDDPDDQGWRVVLDIALLDGPRIDADGYPIGEPIRAVGAAGEPFGSEQGKLLGIYRVAHVPPPDLASHGWDREGWKRSLAIARLFPDLTRSVPRSPVCPRKLKDSGHWFV